MTKEQLIDTYAQSLKSLVETGLAKDECIALIKNAVDEVLFLYGVSVSLPSDPMVLAKYLHDNYEQIAKRANWNTQKSCKVEFEDLPIENKNTMILLAGKIILDFVGNER